MKKNKNKKSRHWLWLVKILLLAFFLSLGFSLLSEFALTKANIVVAVIVIIIFILISMFFDMLAIAITSCDIEPFNSMASRKVKGSKQAIILINNADKVGAICADVIGDVCGILSGAAGASILTKIVISSSSQFLPVFLASLVSAIIASLTIFGKASLKKIAMKNSTAITLKLAQVINFFTRKG